MSKSGFVAIIGRPHVGKSAFIEHLADRQLAKVTHESQITQNFIKAVINKDQAEIIVIGVPLLIKPADDEARQLNAKMLSTLKAVDVIVHMVDASKIIGAEDCHIVEQIEKIKKPKILVLNKVDLVENDELKIQTEVATHLEGFELILPVSSITGTGVNDLLEKITGHLREGKNYFSADVDQPEKTLIEAIIKKETENIVPEESVQSTQVELITLTEEKNLNILADIYINAEDVEQGKRYSDDIETSAAARIEEIFGSNVKVKVEIKGST